MRAVVEDRLGVDELVRQVRDVPVVRAPPHDRGVRDVVVAPHLTDLAIDVLESTHPGRGLALPEVQRFVHFGASPRGLQAMLVTAKTRALLDGRFAVSKDDLAWAALPALRHRIILNFEGEAEGIATDTLLSRILESLEARRALR